MRFDVNIKALEYQANNDSIEHALEAARKQHQIMQPSNCYWRRIDEIKQIGEDELMRRQEQSEFDFS